jgi:hypothetical protein
MVVQSGNHFRDSSITAVIVLLAGAVVVAATTMIAGNCDCEYEPDKRARVPAWLDVQIAPGAILAGEAKGHCKVIADQRIVVAS